MAVRAAILFLAACVCDTINKACVAVTLGHEPPFLCSSLVNSELTWVHPEELEVKAEKESACVA